MKKKISTFILAVTFLLSPIHQAKADLFGGDVAVLTQILANAIQQLAQLRSIMGTGQDTLSLIRDINRGINDSLNLMRTIGPGTDPGIYRDWERVQEAVRALERIYGVIVPSRDAQVQHDSDQSVAEAVALNNSIYKYTRDVDEIGESIKQMSRLVSPGGAQKLTAQSLGVMLTVMNQSLRAQATGLKIQAQSLAIENRKDKEQTRNALETSNALSIAMKQQDTSFQLPRF
ncbi:MAG: hypothetical protein AB7F66_11070 [Bacteriovoracia bacterium]